MENQAAWLPAAKARLEVSLCELQKPGAGEILIRNYALPINPIDVKIQDWGVVIQEYPTILGFEMAGVVEEVGEQVTGLQKGDRVVALAVAIRTKNPAHAGFQSFTLVPDYLAARIPPKLSFTAASVLPLGLATAAAGLYQPEYLGLPPPSAKTEPSKSEKERTILIWGGSSVVGSCAIQLASAAGLTVLTTASAKNLEYVSGLGADVVVDHTQHDAVQKLIAAAAGTTILGAYDVISTKDTATACAEVLHHFGGGKLATTSMNLFSVTQLFGDVQRFVVHPPGPESESAEKPVWVGIWREFLEDGLRNGKLKAKPEPMVKAGGLRVIQEALDLYREGVSATKVVVSI